MSAVPAARVPAAGATSRAALARAAGLGLMAATATDALLALAGQAAFHGPPLGLLGLVLLLALRTPLPAPRELALAAGIAWTVAPLIDQHLTGSVAITGTLPDMVHHMAGWTALAFAWSRR